MENSLNLSLGQKFEVERISRAIDSESDLEVLRGLSKQLLKFLIFCLFDSFQQVLRSS